MVHSASAPMCKQCKTRHWLSEPHKEAATAVVAVQRWESVSLQTLDEIGQMLAAIDNLSDIMAVRDAAEAVRRYHKARGLSRQDQNHAGAIKLLCERRAGELLIEMAEAGERAKGGGDTRAESQPAIQLPTLADLGVKPDQSSRWQAEAKVPQKIFDDYIETTRANDDGEVTQAGLLKTAKQPHVANNSGENEWYSPEQYVEAARRVLGVIDLDPASCALANTVVKAERFYSIEDDAFAQPWQGRVWMNPPYAKEWIGRFIGRLCDFVEIGNVPAAVVLVNNATETDWFGQLAAHAAAFCFLNHRVNFWSESGKVGQPLQGQAIAYIGPDVDAFYREYAGMGWCAEVKHGLP